MSYNVLIYFCKYDKECLSVNEKYVKCLWGVTMRRNCYFKGIANIIREIEEGRRYDSL